MKYAKSVILERLAEPVSHDSPAASTEVINMEAILNLQKETEHILTDIPESDEAFAHVLK